MEITETQFEAKKDFICLYDLKAQGWLALRLRCGLWGSLSLDVMSDCAVWFYLRTALFGMKKMISGTCIPHDLALDLEKESLVEEF